MEDPDAKKVKARPDLRHVVPSKLDTLTYITNTLTGLREMAVKQGCEGVQHFLEMALIEASDTMNRVAKEEANRRNN